MRSFPIPIPIKEDDITRPKEVCVWRKWEPFFHLLKACNFVFISITYIYEMTLDQKCVCVLGGIVFFEFLLLKEYELNVTGTFFFNCPKQPFLAAAHLKNV